MAGALPAIGNKKGASRGELLHPKGVALQIETQEGYPQLYVSDCAQNIIQVMLSAVSSFQKQNSLCLLQEEILFYITRINNMNHIF